MVSSSSSSGYGQPSSFDEEYQSEKPASDICWTLRCFSGLRGIPDLRLFDFLRSILETILIGLTEFDRIEFCQNKNPRHSNHTKYSQLQDLRLTQSDRI